MNTHKVSAVMLAYDEWRSIRPAALSVLPYCDELLLVHTTPTLQRTHYLMEEIEWLCREPKVRYLSRPQEEEKYKWYESELRNWSIYQAKYDWILIHDADEIIEPGYPDYFRTYEAPLRSKRVNLATDFDHYIVAAHRNGEFVSWYPDLQMRYFNRVTVEYADGHNHVQPIFKMNQKVVQHCTGIYTSNLRYWHCNALVRMQFNADVKQNWSEYVIESVPWTKPPLLAKVLTLG